MVLQIHFDGKVLICTARYERLAILPCRLFEILDKLAHCCKA
jgi:hypothetical protein